MNIPEGYVLVPADPIKAIDMGWAYLDAARETEPNKSHSFSHAGYRAMIAAAPAVDIPAYDEAKERELFDAWYEEYVSCGWSVSKAGTWESWKACAQSRARSAE